MTQTDLDVGPIDYLVVELGDEDLAQGAALVGAGDAVAVLLYENTWAGRFVSRRCAGERRRDRKWRIPADEVIAALDAIESERRRAETPTEAARPNRSDAMTTFTVWKFDEPDGGSRGEGS
jgi:hypothetical protein